MINKLKLIVILYILLLLASNAISQDDKLLIQSGPKPNNDELTAEEIFERNKHAIVSIWYVSEGYYEDYQYIEKDTVILSGSGFIISTDGLVATNNHVIESFDSLIVKTYDGNYFPAEIVMIDYKNDLAILKIINSEEINFQAIKFGESDSVKIGNNVYCIGSPLGFEYTISDGIIAGIRKEEKVKFRDYDTWETVEKVFDKVIQITAAISPGNSGGPLFNGKGEVIGIVTYTYEFYGNLNFAVAINALKKLIQSLEIVDIEQEEIKQKRKEELFKRNYKLAKTYRNKVIDNWYYTKQKDTMKTLDTFIVRQDSINHINLWKSETFYNKCIELKPDTFVVYAELMSLYVYIEDYPKAEELYKQIKETFDSDSLLNTLSSTLAEGYIKSKDYKKAITFYEKMIKADSNDIFSYTQIADLYLKMKDYAKALETYKIVIKKDSLNIPAYIRIGKLYYDEKRKYKEAKQYLYKALELSIESSLYGYYGSDYVNLFYLLGMIAVKEKRKTEALIYYLELRGIYTYNAEDNAKKKKLYYEIIKMDD